MAELTTEQFAQRILHLNLLDDRQLETVWSHFGTREVSLQDFSESLVRRGLLTNFQVERVLKGEKSGFFYGEHMVLYFVGNGSFARVYRAAHKQTGKVVALKVLRKRFSDNPLESARFMREGEMGATLRHPNIVPIYEVHSHRRTFYIVMAFVEGQSLREFVKIRRVVEPLEATRIMAGIISGLAYAAEKGITHRDIKLSNVLISSDGKPQLVDFGLAAMDASDRGESYTNARTIDYAALEKITGVRKDDSRSDVYFAGCLFYHMLSGKPALSETRDRMQRMNMARFRDITPIRELAPDLPPAVEAVVTKSMELDVNRRYGKPVEFLLDLQKALKQMEASAAETEVVAELHEGDSKTVLLVESNSSVQDALREGLKKHGYRVLVISDPRRALGRFDDDPRFADAAIISTVVLGRDALEMLRNMSTRHATANLPTILLLGKSQARIKDRLALQDHQAVVTMPLKMAHLRRVLRELLAPVEADRQV